MKKLTVFDKISRWRYDLFYSLPSGVRIGIYSDVTSLGMFTVSPAVHNQLELDNV